MAAIDIGGSAVNGDSYMGNGYTCLDLTNPANASGKITSVSIYGNSDYGTKGVIGVFYGSGNSWTCRDYHIMTSQVSAGTVGTITVDLDVQVGDILGLYCNSGWFELNTTGGSGVLYAVGNKTIGGAATFSLNSGYTMRMSGSGETVVTFIPQITIF
jgi:hypothetical protein